MIAELAVNGFTAGIDISDVMVRQAAKRNQPLIRSGNIELGQANVANIPYEFARFNKVLAVNNYQFWPNAEHNLTEIQRVLSEDGLLVLCLGMKKPNKAFKAVPGFNKQEVEDAASLMRWVGFRDVHQVKRRVGSEAICLIARK
jgi:ubiquinone/menaquinone biosynthesis C-methylase UbiE